VTVFPQDSSESFDAPFHETISNIKTAAELTPG
jgi:hypothetical protein